MLLNILPAAMNILLQIYVSQTIICQKMLNIQQKTVTVNVSRLRGLKIRA